MLKKKILLMANLVCEGYLLTKPSERKIGEEIVNALHLGHRSVASDLLSQLGSGEQAPRVRSFIPILQYCARMPDPLVGIFSPAYSSSPSFRPS